MTYLTKTFFAAALLAGAAFVSTADAASVAGTDALDASRFLLRGRVIAVVPDESSSLNIGGEANVGDAVTPEFDLTYFFTDNIGAELIAATAQHSLSASNTAIGNLELGTTWILPPTLTLQYHFAPEATFRPYLGAGVNYSVFYGEDEAAGISNLEVDNAWGLAAQAGFDYALNEKWAVNVDVKKLWMNVDVSVNDGVATADVDLDPWIFGVGLAYRF